MTSPTIYKPSVYASVPAAPAAPSGNGYPGFAPSALATPSAATGPSTVYAAPASPAISPPMNVAAMFAFISALLGFGVISLVVGVIGLSQIKTNGERGRGFAIAGIIIAAVAVVSVVLLCVALFVLYQIGVAAGY